MAVDGGQPGQREVGASDEATGFERALEGLRETGASVSIRNLVELLATHGAEEGRLLAEYEHLASSASDPAARFLVELIMEDERRHHRLLVQMAIEMAWGTDRVVETGLPPLGWHLDPDLMIAIRTLRQYEEKDRHELQALKKRLRPFEETTLWSLIVQLMLLDTEKHATILRFLEHHARGE